MAQANDNVSMAVFCDFENIALGVRDVRIDKFDIKRVLERLLVKGSIVVKKAYCDWDRYKTFKAPMHEASFELIEIPHVRQSGKNSADIRLVVDALDLCYTKSHVDTFVIISGDSDFSPLVSKLRENAKQVIGVGVRQSTSDLLIANCDEFIFYDDLVPEPQRASPRRDANPQGGRQDKTSKEGLEARRSQAVAIAVETFDALLAERGESGKIWASMLKEAIKRRRPDFNESNYGFRAFGSLLEAAQSRGLLSVGRDEKSGAFVYRKHGAEEDGVGEVGAIVEADTKLVTVSEESDRRDPIASSDRASEATPAQAETTKRAANAKAERGRGRGRQRKAPAELSAVELSAPIDAPAGGDAAAGVPTATELAPTEAAVVAAVTPSPDTSNPPVATEAKTPAAKRSRSSPRKSSPRRAASDAVAPPAESVAAPVANVVPEGESVAAPNVEGEAAPAKPRRRSAPKRPKKTADDTSDKTDESSNA